MKLVSHYLESIAGIEIYPIVSFLIFFSFFLIVTYLVIKMDKKEVSDLANLPLENDNDSEAASELNL
jgi:cytochrome c oxidase cbb3-type subunit 4